MALRTTSATESAPNAHQLQHGNRQFVAAFVDPVEHERRHDPVERAVEVVDAVVEDDRRQAVFERGGSGDEITAEAVAEQADPVGRDFRPGQRVVDNGGDHGLPVGAEDQPLLAQCHALAWSVKSQHVVTAGNGGSGDHEIRLLGR